MLRLTILWLALFFCACNPVYSTRPVGDKPRSLGAEKAEWEGTWVHGDGAITVVVTDAERGKLRAGWFEKAGDGLQPRVFDVELRTFGKWTFASVKDPDKPRYIITRVEREDRQLLLFQANTDRWKDLIAAKKIPGDLRPIKKSDGKVETEVTAGPLGAKELAFITAEEQASLFRWSQPTSFVKIGK